MRPYSCKENDRNQRINWEHYVSASVDRCSIVVLHDLLVSARFNKYSSYTTIRAPNSRKVSSLWV